MTRVAIFDSGLGSLSVVWALRKAAKTHHRNLEIIYFADQLSYPYGTKTKPQLRKIITATINAIKKNLKPDFIIVGSNTPSLLFPRLTSKQGIAGILPPIREAAEKTKTNNIAILATESSLKHGLDSYIAKQVNSGDITAHKINATTLIDLVEKMHFVSNKRYCRKVIRNTLSDNLKKNKIDVATLSSTHLPFLRELLEIEFPMIHFIDPAEDIADKIVQLLPEVSTRNTIKIYTSANPAVLQEKLRLLGIRDKKIARLDIWN